MTGFDDQESSGQHSMRSVGCQTEFTNNVAQSATVELAAKKAEATLALNLSLFCQWQWYALYLMGQARGESLRHSGRYRYGSRQRRTPKPTTRDQTFEGPFGFENQVAAETVEGTVDNIWRHLTIAARSAGEEGHEPTQEIAAELDVDSGSTTKERDNAASNSRGSGAVGLATHGGLLADSLRVPRRTPPVDDVSPHEDFSSDADSVFQRSTKQPSSLSRLFLRYARRCDIWASGKGGEINGVNSFWSDVKKGWEDESLFSADGECDSGSEAASTPVSDSTSLSEVSDPENIVTRRTPPDVPRQTASRGIGSVGGAFVVPSQSLDARMASRRVEASHRAEMLSVGEIEGLHRFMLRQWRRAVRRKRRDYSRDRRDASRRVCGDRSPGGRRDNRYRGGAEDDTRHRDRTDGSPLGSSSAEKRVVSHERHRRRRHDYSSSASTERVVLYDETCASSSGTRPGKAHQSRSRHLCALQPLSVSSAGVSYNSSNIWSSGGVSASRTAAAANSSGSDLPRQRMRIDDFIDASFSLPLAAQVPDFDIAAVLKENSTARRAPKDDTATSNYNRSARDEDVDEELLAWSRLPTLVACLMDVLRDEGYSDEWLLNEGLHALCQSSSVVPPAVSTEEEQCRLSEPPSSADSKTPRVESEPISQQVPEHTTRRRPVVDEGFTGEIRLADNPLDRLQLTMYLKVLVVMFLFDCPKEFYAVVFLFLALHVHGILDPIIHAFLSEVQPRPTLDQTLAELRERQEPSAEQINSDEVAAVAESSTAGTLIEEVAVDLLSVEAAPTDEAGEPIGVFGLTQAEEDNSSSNNDAGAGDATPSTILGGDLKTQDTAMASSFLRETETEIRCRCDTQGAATKEAASCDGEADNTSENDMSNPSFAQRAFYQLVVMFVGTLLPWWRPDDHYLC